MPKRKFYHYHVFCDKDTALAYRKNHGGVLYNLEQERKRLMQGKVPNSLAVIEGVEAKYKFSVEGTELVDENSEVTK